MQVWAAIVRAPALLEGLPIGGSLVLIRFLPPDLFVFTRIFETVVIQVRSLEAQLMSSSRQYARMRRARNPNVIFGDLKAAPSNEVDYLLRPLSATVVEIRSEDHAVVLSHPQPWDDTKPIVCHGLALPVIHAEEDCLWLQDIDAVSRADVVTQLHCTGTKEDLEAAFAQAWKARWDRHRDVPFERWNVILDFARRFLPRRQLRWPSITPEELGQLVVSKQDSSACGLDGVSIRDLKSMPSTVLSNFCDMFSMAEETGQWPSQLLMGKVVCLAKVEQPRDVMNYRPITILGLLYRLWCSYHARRAIRMLDPFLPRHFVRQ